MDTSGVEVSLCFEAWAVRLSQMNRDLGAKPGRRNGRGTIVLRHGLFLTTHAGYSGRC